MDKRTLAILGAVASALSTIFAICASISWCALAVMKIKEIREDENYQSALKNVLLRLNDGFNRRFWKKEIEE